MENPIYIGLSRQMSLRNEMDVIAHNIANANTPSFKAEKMVFREFLRDPEGGEDISLVQDVGLARDMTEGPIEPTGNPLDVAIHGEGFLAVETPLGERYTRNGRLQRDVDGTLTTGAGYPVLGDGGPIVIPEGGGPVQISSDGTLSNEDGIFGKLRLVRFDEPENMTRGEHGLYSTEQEPAAVEQPEVSQGMIEGSNVQPILEMTRMMSVARGDTGVSKFMDQEDERIKAMISSLGNRPS